jgi:hypothetical protein
VEDRGPSDPCHPSIFKHMFVGIAGYVRLRLETDAPSPD